MLQFSLGEGDLITHQHWGSSPNVPPGGLAPTWSPGDANIHRYGHDDSREIPPATQKAGNTRNQHHHTESQLWDEVREMYRGRQALYTTNCAVLIAVPVPNLYFFQSKDHSSNDIKLSLFLLLLVYWWMKVSVFYRMKCAIFSSKLTKCAWHLGSTGTWIRMCKFETDTPTPL